MTCEHWPLVISHMSDFSYHPAPLVELKSIKQPNILLNISGLCHAAASSDTFRVIMVITHPLEARPEAPRGRGQPRELEAAEEGVMGGQGKGNGLPLRHAVKHRHCIRGRGVDVGVPSEPLSMKVLSLIPALGFMF